MEQMTFRQKAENFWYYYKWYVIGGALLLCALLVAIGSCAQKQKTDLYVMTAGKVAPNALQSHELEEWLAGMIDEEGEKSAQVISVATMDQWSGTNSTAMLVQVNSGKMVLYLLQEGTYKILHDNKVLQDLSFAGESPYLDGDRYLLSESGALNDLESFSAEEEDYYLCIRKVEGTSMAGNAHYKQQEAYAKEILQKLIKEEK